MDQDGVYDWTETMPAMSSLYFETSAAMRKRNKKKTLAETRMSHCRNKHLTSYRPGLVQSMIILSVVIFLVSRDVRSSLIGLRLSWEQEMEIQKAYS
ncbi:hypothetical protein NPIL_604711 [Nephila pilipes]|uniref:PIK helical domain-containing protein n=1 Tax=Nephila pilipes TaxID=299642 RepID=A0A8X6J3K2_NEPPI|nr:hypothetical protein NPIL_604711 [Nephila pilipes]